MVCVFACVRRVCASSRVYGELYLRAWSKATFDDTPAKFTPGSQLSQQSEGSRIEACLQELMSAAVHAASPK